MPTIRTKETKQRRKLIQWHVVLAGVAIVLSQGVGSRRGVVLVMATAMVTATTTALGTTTMAKKTSRTQTGQTAM